MTMMRTCGRRGTATTTLLLQNATSSSLFVSLVSSFILLVFFIASSFSIREAANSDDAWQHSNLLLSNSFTNITNPQISAEGDRILFGAVDLSEPENGFQLFLFDLRNNGTTLVSVDANTLSPAPAGTVHPDHGFSMSTRVSIGGRHNYTMVAFVSSADLVSDDPNHIVYDRIFLRILDQKHPQEEGDEVCGGRARMWLAVKEPTENSAVANKQLTNPVLSWDGRVLAFESNLALDRVYASDGKSSNVYRVATSPSECISNSPSIVSMPKDPAKGNNGDSSLAAVSGTGRYIAFTSSSTELAVVRDSSQFRRRDIGMNRLFLFDGGTMGNSAAGLSSRSARGIAYVGGEYPATEPHQFNPVVNFQGTGVVFVDLVQDPNDSTWSRKQLTYVPIDTDQFTVGTKKVLEADVSIEEAFGRGMHLQRQVSLSADGDSVVYSNNDSNGTLSVYFKKHIANSDAVETEQVSQRSLDFYNYYNNSNNDNYNNMMRMRMMMMTTTTTTSMNLTSTMASCSDRGGQVAFLASSSSSSGNYISTSPLYDLVVARRRCDKTCAKYQVCSVYGSCVCPWGYTGDSCEIPICEPACGRDYHCVAPYRCECKSGSALACKIAENYVAAAVIIAYILLNICCVVCCIVPFCICLGAFIVYKKRKAAKKQKQKQFEMNRYDQLASVASSSSSLGQHSVNAASSASPFAQIDALNASADSTNANALLKKAADGVLLNIDATEFIIPWDKLTITAKIASGSFGTVYKATWGIQTVAVKELKFGLADASEQDLQDFVKEFQNEVALLSKIRHTYVLNFFGACIESPRYAIVTEFMDLGSLHYVLHNAKSPVKLTWDQKLAISIHIASAMTFLHEKNITHRDLKTHNILLDKHLNGKVCDFGLAKSKTAYSQAQNQMTQAVGTPLYMAPEVVTGRNYDSSCDVFSFGIIMWEILAGRIPYDHVQQQPGGGVTMIHVKVSLEPDFRPEEPVLNEGDDTEVLKIQQQYIELYKRCWQAEPADRPKFPEIFNLLSQMEQELKQR